MSSLMEVLRVHALARSYFRCRDDIGCSPELLSRSLARRGPSNDAHSVTRCVMRNYHASYGQANRSVVAQNRLDCYLHGFVPAGTLATRGAPAPAPREPSAATRSGSQLGPKRKVTSREFAKAE